MIRKPTSPSARLEALYAELPALACRQKCGAAYCGPVLMTGLEERRLSDRLGHLPMWTDGLRCGALEESTGLCLAYRQRPAICRLWGCVPRLACPHGCTPERWLTDAEAFAFLGRVEALSTECGFEREE